MFKVGVVGGLLLLSSAFANPVLMPSYFVGKWQCQTKNNDPTIKQDHGFHFLKNGKLVEHIRVYYGKQTAYDYQIETAISHSDWKIQGDTLVYPNYKIHTYKVRMPNSKKDDIQQATIAVEKSLPIIQMMMNQSVNRRQFDVSVIDKKSFLMNDVENLMFMTCHKKGVLSGLF